jgi:hypothetical protein
MASVPWWVPMALVLACLIPSVVQLVMMGDMARDMRRMAETLRALNARAHTGEDRGRSAKVALRLDGRLNSDSLGIAKREV